MVRLLLSLLCVGALLPAASVHEVLQRAQDLERSGDVIQARGLLARTAADAGHDAGALLAYAEFLDRHRDPGRREAYEKSLEAVTGESRRPVARRLVVLALLEGDVAAAKRHAANYHEAGGTGLDRLDQTIAAQTLPPDGWTEIPGPLFSFRRMAALSTDQAPEELLPALARNIFTNGYRASRGAESLEQTEYLKLILQYLSQARELQQLAGAQGVIDIPDCESEYTAQLLKILGFRFRSGCGPEAVLETVNPSRSFLSIDSGFPLADLEQAFREGKPFRLPYTANRVPVMFGTDYWIDVSGRKAKDDFIDTFLRDPAMARLYVAMSELHGPTADVLRRDIKAERLKNFAHVLDFFGGMFEIRDGKAVVPGGAAMERSWEKLVGVSPSNPAEFFQRLVEVDDGWLASYFDALLHVRGDARQRYFLHPERFGRFYEALRGRVTSPGPARPIFRANSELMLLSSRLHFNPDGSPHIPGGIGAWRRLFIEHPHGKYDGKLTKSAEGWKTSDDVVEAMFALCRKAVENEPLKMFMAFTNLDRARTQPLSEAAISRLILRFPRYGSQLSLFNDAGSVAEETVGAYFDLLPVLDKIGRPQRRADTIGMFQALTGLWQIFCRQGQIPAGRADESLRQILESFKDVKGDEEIFDAGRSGIKNLLTATGSPADASPQDRLVELIAGQPGSGDAAAYKEVVDERNTRFAQQRLVSIKDLFDLADHLERVSRGEALNVAMANRLAARISEVRLPRSNLSSQESTSFAQGHWVERHIQRQRSLNLRRLVDRAQGESGRLLSIRGELAPMLRDSLVGLNYIAYSPPGAELIRANPLFVRSHDFVGTHDERSWRPARLLGTGWPSSGGGRLVGSLSGLPYALAEAEQNFMIPSERQALIWQDLAPQILLGATVPRWWNVTPADLHYVGLHLRLGEQLLAQAAVDSTALARVKQLLSERVEPARMWRMEASFLSGHVANGVAEIAPAETFELASQWIEKYPEEASDWGAPFTAEISRLRSATPEQHSQQRIASLFGVPHPELSHSYRLELLNLPLFPTMMGYSSRILAESWESTNLYWAALADELHLAPARLNLLIPQWTQESLERIFATHLDDWPALLHSMRVVGERYREQMRPRIEQQVRAGWNDHAKQLE